MSSAFVLFSILSALNQGVMKLLNVRGQLMLFLYPVPDCYVVMDLLEPLPLFGVGTRLSKSTWHDDSFWQDRKSVV